MRWTAWTLIALLGAWGCTGGMDALPQDKASYAGRWRAPGMDLRIYPNGRVEYARQKANGTSKVSAPILEFEGDSFKVGAFIFSTTFEVERAPYQDGGVWRMTIDGVDLTRVDDELEAPPSD
ncbi:hypothetical protein KKF91_05290 [Myxococcota bacterium]|nr:hypothetical protein [Myxococcota bacterium]MBU1429962.1 hypothetical protein [Myxococcota bacterium]MBU1896819.1 hypothetical protein [Myxococcota bacterium]